MVEHHQAGGQGNPHGGSSRSRANNWGSGSEEFDIGSHLTSEELDISDPDAEEIWVSWEHDVGCWKHALGWPGKGKGKGKGGSSSFRLPSAKGRPKGGKGSYNTSYPYSKGKGKGKSRGKR